jgi:hypothetical protein
MLAVTGCGGENPPNRQDVVAAQVGGVRITAQQVKHEVRIARRYKYYKALRQTPRTILRTMIREDWRRQEAVARGVKLPAEPLSRVARRTYVYGALRSAVLGDREFPVTKKEIRSYFISHRQELGQPEGRLVRIIEARTRGWGMQAVRALRAGELPAEVRARYGKGVPNVTQDRTGLTVFQRTAGRRSPALDSAVFQAKKKAVTGPVKAGSVWYVIQVLDSHPAVRPTIESSRKQIVDAVSVSKITAYFNKYLKRLEARYMPRTKCTKRWMVPECQNRLGQQS